MPVKAYIRQLAGSAGLLDPLVELKVAVEGFSLHGLARNLQYRTRGAPDGLPIPSPHLIYLVIGSRDVHAFLESGRVHAHKLILGTLARNGFALAEFDNVLDFGCGCGRVMRYWAAQDRVHLHGTDYNPKLIAWCRRNLPFADYQVNGLRPPLSYVGGTFDLVYARSVFTHLPEALQSEWLAELRRILRPGGMLLFTVSGRTYRSWMTDDEQERYDAGQLVVRDGDRAGRNLCAVFHPQRWMEERIVQGGYDVVDVVPGREVEYLYQDTYLVRRV